MQIPHTALKTETLLTVIEEYVTREGTEYGLDEHDLEKKVCDVLDQLERGQVFVTFNDETQTVSIATDASLEEAAKLAERALERARQQEMGEEIVIRYD